MEILAVRKCEHFALRKGFYIKVSALLNAERRLLYVFANHEDYNIQLFFVDERYNIEDPEKWMLGKADKDTLEGNSTIQGLSASALHYWLIKLKVL